MGSSRRRARSSRSRIRAFPRMRSRRSWRPACGQRAPRCSENIFTNRYRHAEEFRRLGAAVSIEGRVAYVTGVERLTGAPLTASDLRGGAAMLVAGLCAEGATELLDNGYIDRGYDRFDACLSALGADVRCAAPR